MSLLVLRLAVVGIDIRIPIGLLFALLGLVLTAFGAAGNRSIYNRSLGVNVNLWWGLALLAFGVVMLALARPWKHHRRAVQAEQRRTQI